MRKLYWKIFLWFWLVTFLLIASASWLTLKISQETIITGREQALVSTFTSVASVFLDLNKKDSLKNWQANLKKNHEINLYVVTQSGSLVGGQHLSKETARIVSQLQRHMIPDYLFKINNYIITAPWAVQNGQVYRVIIQLPSPLLVYFRVHWLDLLLRIGLALLITGLVCYLLSIYLTSPLQLLQTATVRLGRGRLHTRVRASLISRNDEIGQLAKEFNAMASSMENLVKGQTVMLRNVSHELRSPLARLGVALEIARKKDAGVVAKELDRIELESERLDELIGQILSLMRMEHMTHQSIEKTRLDLGALISTVVSDTNYEISGTDNSVRFHADEHYWVMANPDFMHSVFENIIRNAVRYTDSEKGVDVTMTKRRQGRYHMCIVVVRDYGSGVPEETLKILFDPFYRVDDARTKALGGYGLGLSIVKKAVGLHGGSVKVFNHPDGGLVFQVHLPLGDCIQ